MSRVFAPPTMPKIENMRNYTTPYVFQEYPKWIKLADGQPFLVNDADEEAAAIGKPEPKLSTWNVKGKANA